MEYRFSLAQQLTSGIVGFLTVIIATRIFDGEIEWVLALAVGIAVFLTSGLHKKT